MAQKHYTDYLEQVYEKFPDIDKESIDNIILFGLKKMYKYIKCQQDIFLKLDCSKNPFFMYIGTSETDPQKQYIESKFRQHKKIRTLFKESKQEWDGYYYIGLTDEEFNQTTPIEKVTCYKLKEEASIRKGIKHILKIKLEGITSWSLNKFNYEKSNEQQFYEGP